MISSLSELVCFSFDFLSKLCVLNLIIGDSPLLIISCKFRGSNSHVGSNGVAYLKTGLIVVVVLLLDVIAEMVSRLSPMGNVLSYVEEYEHRFVAYVDICVSVQLVSECEYNKAVIIQVLFC